MSAALWLARSVDEHGRAQTLRCRCAEAPGPDQIWEPIDDPFERARESSTNLDPLTLAERAEPRAEARVLARLLPPVRPQKIFGIGRNYRAHAEELGNEVPQSPLCFFKPPSCLLVSGDPLELPRGFDRIDMEAELVAVIGRRAKQVTARDAWAHVAGYLVGNDVSCRDLQRRDRQWTRAKGFDGFGPISAYLRLVQPDFELPAASLRIRAYLDDQPVQDGAVADMIFSIPTLIEHLSACMTLEPGDLIFTGTPAGVSPLSPGQVVRVELEGFELGRLVTPII